MLVPGLFLPVFLNPSGNPAVQEKADQRHPAQEEDQQRAEGKQDAGEGQESQQVGKEAYRGIVNLRVIGKVSVAAGKALVLQCPEMLILLVPVIGGQPLAGDHPQEPGVHFELVPVYQLPQVFLQSAQYRQRGGEGSRYGQYPSDSPAGCDFVHHDLRQERRGHRYQAVDQDNQQAEHE